MKQSPHPSNKTGEEKLGADPQGRGKRPRSQFKVWTYIQSLLCADHNDYLYVVCLSPFSKQHVIGLLPQQLQLDSCSTILIPCFPKTNTFFISVPVIPYLNQQWPSPLHSPPIPSHPPTHLSLIIQSIPQCIYPCWHSLTLCLILLLNTHLYTRTVTVPGMFSASRDVGGWNSCQMFLIPACRDVNSRVDVLYCIVQRPFSKCLLVHFLITEKPERSKCHDLGF